MPRSALDEPQAAAAIIAELLGLGPGVRLERYYGERSLFYNPGGAAPLGAIFASIKDHDGPNDQASRLSRPGVYRLAFEMAPEVFATHFGPVPSRPPRGAAVALAFDPTTLNELAPHPVYAWMRWVQILSPSPRQFASLRSLLDESLALAKEKWQRRRA
jgi:Family of unknown function (DUF6194)